MSEDGTNSDAGPEGSEAGAAERMWRRIVTAAEWVADTFRGHSGAGQLKNREK